MRIDKWLKYEQIGLNLLTIGLFLVGFGFSYAVPRGAAASHEKVETQITEISSAAKAQEGSLTELKDIIAASREEQAQQQDAYFKRLDDINVKQDDVLKAVDKLRQTTSDKRKPIQTKSGRTGRGPNGRRWGRVPGENYAECKYNPD
jgi:prefoldin subunit 5